MKDGFRQTMAFLHSWAGLIPGWLLYAVFLAGSLTYYRQEITQWMRPELSGAVADPQAVRHAVTRLAQESGQATLWRIDLPTARNPVTEILWKQEEGGFTSEDLDPRTGGPMQVRDTRGGDFLYYFHFDLNGPARIGRWLVCLATIVMLVAIISGVIIHRRIFADFFTFRPGKGQRSWLDAHNIAGVAALPYHLMISFSGLVTLIPMFMPWAIMQAYPGDRASYADDLAGGTTAATLSAPRVEGMIPGAVIESMVARARTAWSGGEAGRILVDNPLSNVAMVTVERRDSDRVSYDRAWLRFSADGRLVARHDGGGAAVTTQGWLYGLHLARFSGWGLRLLFFFSGLLGTAMIATGLILWVVKRRPRPGIAASIPVAERMNVAAIAGLPLAIAALLLANRLLPVALAGRAGWEVTVFFLSWLGALVHASYVAPAQGWRWQWRAFAALCLLAPLPLMAVTGSGLFAWIARGDQVRATIDLVLISTGLIVMALTLIRRRSRAA